MTKTGAFLGTPRYMSPEQVEGKPADQRSDLYSYGLMLYEMVGGDVPFTGESTLKVMYQRIQEKPKSPKLLNPSLPNWFVRIIMRCLEKEPAARYQSAYEILADLQGSRGSASGSHTVQIQIPQFVAERRWTWVVAGVLAVVLLAFAIPPVRHLILGGGTSGRQKRKWHTTAFTGKIRCNSAVQGAWRRSIARLRCGGTQRRTLVKIVPVERSPPRFGNSSGQGFREGSA